MSSQEILIDRQTFKRFLSAVKHFLFPTEEDGPEAVKDGWLTKLMLAALILLLLGINGMNVFNNYVGRDFMTAIENRNHAGFIRLAWIYLGVFAGATLVGVFAKFTEDRLALRWRERITQRAIDFYLEKGTYYHLESGTMENPDQRIAEDVRSFTATTLSFLVIILNSSVTIAAFSGVVWSISPLLFAVAVLYAAGGSYVTFKLGRPLVKLNYDQLDKDANFRSALIHVRDNAEPLLLAHREGRLAQRLTSCFDEVAGNVRKVIAVNRNLGLFVGGYYWLIGLIPALIVAPSFMEGKIEFGVVTQAAMAFSILVGALSLIITQFQSISSFAAVLSRLGVLGEAIGAFEPAKRKPSGDIHIAEQEDQVGFAGLSLQSPKPGELLVKDLSLSIPFGTRVLVTAANDVAKKGLFKATAGLLIPGTGQISRPGPDKMLFLARRPYMLPGTLRELLLPRAQDGKIPDEQLADLLQEVGLKSLSGDLGADQDWNSILSLAEQQLLSFVHILLWQPRFVFLDRPGTVLTAEQLGKVLKMLNERSISYITSGIENGTLEFYDAILDIQADGSWSWKTLPAGGVQP